MYGIIENPASERGLEASLVAKMETASAELRAQETTVTKDLISAYEKHVKYCREYYKQYGINPGGWNSLFSLRDKVALIAAKAVSVENETMFQELWLSGAWQSETWVGELVAALEKEAKACVAYYNNRSQRWEHWAKEGGDPGQALEDKRMQFNVERNDRYIRHEIWLLKQLDEFGKELRKGSLPDPSSDCDEANQYLVLLYKQRLQGK